MVTHQGTKRSIGGTNLIKEEPFIEMEVDLSKNDCIYLSSDGYRDQNNAERKRLGSKRMLDGIRSSADEPMETQKGKLEQFLIEYSQNEEQRDDITVWGIRI